jgi:phosphate transport system substrate-binding protein
MFLSRATALAGFGLALLVAAGCGGSSRQTTMVTLDGSSTVFPISEAVAEEFQKVTPGTRVTVGISGTGGGFQKFCRGETDISNASRPISKTEIDACAASGIGFIELPIAYDGIAIVVNPKASWIDHITVAELQKLWAPEAQGKVTRWSHVREGWPDREIHLFGAGVDSGTFDYFTEAVTGKVKASRGDFTSSEDDNVLVQGLASDELGLAFLPFAYYEENQASLKLISVDDGVADNGEGPVAPGPESIRTGTYQPLARPVFIYVSTAAAERPEVQAFVDFYLQEAESLVREVKYVGLGAEAYELVGDRFEKRVTGTLFGGGEPTVGLTIDQLLAKERAR